MDLNPARRARHVLTVILGTPALNKTEADCAHFRELINRLKAVIDRLAQQLRELLVVKDLQTAAWRYFAYCGRMEVVVVVTLAALNENAAVTQTLGEYFSSHIIEMHTFNINTLASIEF